MASAKRPRLSSVEGALSSSPGGLHGKRGWSLVFHLMPWQHSGDDALASMPLRIEIPVSEASLGRWMKRLDTNMVVRVAVGRVQPPGDRPWHLAIGKVPVRRVPGSASLRAAQSARVRPVIIRDPVLGRLALEREYDWFAGHRVIDGRRCRIAVARSSASEDAARDLRDIERAGKVIRRLERGLAGILRRIARDKLPLYNDVWRDERPPLSSRHFLARIRLESIVVHGDGAATMYFRDGGLFLGHAIEVRIGSRGAISETCLGG